MGRGLIIALVISLAANIFAGGFIAGRLIGDNGGERGAVVSRPDPGPLARGSVFRLVRMADILPETAQKALRQEIANTLPKVRSKFSEVRSLRRQYHGLVQTTPWDGAAVRAANQELRRVQSEYHNMLDTAFIDIMESLSEADRALLNDALKRDNERFRRRGEGRRPGGRHGDRRGGPGRHYKGSPPVDHDVDERDAPEQEPSP